MNCAETKKLFSPYLDGRASGSEMRALTRHVAQCTGCEREYAAMQRTQELLASLGPKKAPADLALKLRLAISREAAQTRRPRFEGALVRLENALNSFMVPATAGLLSAVLTFGLLLGSFACRPNCKPAAETFRSCCTPGLNSNSRPSAHRSAIWAT